MSEQVFDRRAEAWLASGPDRAPAEAVEAVLSAIVTVPQERARLRVAGRPIGASRREAVLAAAAVVLAVAVAGALFIRGTQSEVAATPIAKDPDSLLIDFPPVAVLLEESGGPEPAARTIDLGTVEVSRMSVGAVQCSGADDIEVETPVVSGTVQCTGKPEFFVGRFMQSGPLPMRLTVGAGVSWHVAFGEYAESSATQPRFETVPATEGWTVLWDLEAEPALPGGGMAAAVETPADATRLRVVINCEGDASLTVGVEADANVPGSAAAGERVALACAEAGGRRLEFPVSGGQFLTVRVLTDAPAWIGLYAEVDAGVARAWPTAPALPAELAATPYVEADAEHLAFGTLGSNEQQLVRVPSARPSAISGDRVAVGVADGGGEPTRLELWSVSGRTSIAVLTEVAAPRAVMQSWVDATHEQVLYSVWDPGSETMELRRVGFDASGDRLVLRFGPGLTGLSGVLSDDDLRYVVSDCAAAGCTMQVLDTATGEATVVAIDGDPVCRIVGLVEDAVVATTGASCLERGPTATMLIPLDGQPARVLVEGGADGVIVLASTGPLYVYPSGAPGTAIELRAVDLAGGTPRELASFEDAEAVRSLSPVRLPAGDWVLFAGPLADTPNAAAVLRPVPLLLNVVTGQQIPLVNLPHSTD